MKVIFKQIVGGSGVDVWANNLSSGLVENGIDSSVSYFSPFYAFFPQALSLKKDSYDFYITHSNIAYGSYFKTSGPLVVTEHHLVHDPSFSQYTSLSQKAYYKFVYLSEKKCLQVADTVTCVSKYTKQKLEEVFEYYDSKLIYNGVNTNVFRPISIIKEKYGVDADKTVLFFAGNLSIRKGADLLPKIMRELGDDFLLVTTSGLRSNFKDHFTNIMTLGRLSEDELVNIYNLCDIFLFPSRLEGFGLAVAEAMSCGKPIVTTDCSSLPELVMDGKGGFLCNVDCTQEFVESIRLLANDENMRLKMGRFNRRRVENLFSSDQMIDQYIKLYAKL
ncbi:glycosyltransferase family 4 protein [Methanosarcina sp. KYL-1]|uniref:glycosyltransferase family 4 protein n=1 Tax=Methanosarcina sp. KYL-1 TaxID=2602068 RepID=UPI002101CA24|nr:glycosyltransferase family 4 protein [Methanosarcina sp. KYL-1]MCQ1535093.1 glycosyltransferase family 4 protein [Methanosarcina sp. KYL-1]